MQLGCPVTIVAKPQKGARGNNLLYNIYMQPETMQRLIELNRRFYAEFGPAFAATRRRIQDGVRRALAGLPDAPGERWLDLGCGSGALALEWLRGGRRSSYLGLDFSGPLLAEARQVVAGWEETAARPSAAGTASFAMADLGSPDWAHGLSGEFRGVLAFAVLHHLPGKQRRVALLQQVRALLPPGGWFVHSVWQFQHSARLLARVQPWSLAGLAEADVEPGDTLLDWRYALPGQAERVGLRYVHAFTRPELIELAQASGFTLRTEFESDGQGGRLGLYQVWEAL
jgi:tRNA (uracil-5-)-methyltransferase TRM9